MLAAHWQTPARQMEGPPSSPVHGVMSGAVGLEHPSGTVQVPAVWQTSIAAQVTGVLVQPVAGLQPAVSQASLGQLIGGLEHPVGTVHVPAPWQASRGVQASGGLEHPDPTVHVPAAWQTSIGLHAIMAPITQVEPPHMAPAWQLSGVHAWPQLPQLLLLLVRSTQAPPQPVIAAPQQTPAEQVVPAPHAVLQPPQWFESVCSSTHAPAQQVEPAAQALPHMPQLAGSVKKFTHAVGFVLLGQLPGNAPLQPTHVDPLHIGLLFAGAGVGHATHVAGVPQALVPAGHGLHMPPAHPAGHVIPQPPQLRGSVCSLTHELLHDVKPVEHVHVPAVQTEFAVHTLPHVPQLLLSLVFSTQMPGVGQYSPGEQTHVLPVHEEVAGQTVVHPPQ